MKRGLLVVFIVLLSFGALTGYLFVRIAYREVPSLWEVWQRRWNGRTGNAQARRYEAFEKEIWPAVRKELKARNLDGWLLFDRGGENRVLQELLPLEGDSQKAPGRKSAFSHAWAIFLPRQGMPGKIVHPMDAGLTDGIPGKECLYLDRQDWNTCLEGLLRSAARIAADPLPGKAGWEAYPDTGATVLPLVGRSVETVSSAELKQLFLARLSPAQLVQHRQAAERLVELIRLAFSEIREQREAGRPYTIGQLKQFLSWRIEGMAMHTAFPPLVSTGKETAIPYYSPASLQDKMFLDGDLVQLELAACMDEPNAIYAKTAWVGYMGRQIPPEYDKAFQACRLARSSALRVLRKALLEGRPVTGSDADREIRQVLLVQGYPDAPPHASGHSLGRTLNGFGANLESSDHRPLIWGTAFTLEPGIYLRDFGLRSTINVYLHPQAVEVTTLPEQEEIVPILN